MGDVGSLSFTVHTLPFSLGKEKDEASEITLKKYYIEDMRCVALVRPRGKRKYQFALNFEFGISPAWGELCFLVCSFAGVLLWCFLFLRGYVFSTLLRSLPGWDEVGFGV